MRFNCALRPQLVAASLLVLMATGCQQAHGFLNLLKDKEKASEMTTTRAAEQQVDASQNGAAEVEPARGADDPLAHMKLHVKQRTSVIPAENAKQLADLERIRQAAAEQARLAELNGFPVPTASDESEDDEDDDEDEGYQASVKQFSVRPSISALHIAFRKDLAMLRKKEAPVKGKAPQANELDDDDGDRGDDDDDDDDDDLFGAGSSQPNDGDDSDSDEVDVEIDKTGRRRRMRQGDLLNHKFVDTRTKSPDAIDKSNLKVTLGRRTKAANSTNAKADSEQEAKRKSKFLTGKYWTKTMNDAYKVTKKVVIKDIPKYVERTSDTLSAMLQLDSKGRLLALIGEVNADIKFVRKEFSQMTITWTPIIEKALNYLGDKNLEIIKWNEKDELDFSRDALHSLAFGYEFMRIMISWRENLLVAHEAYKLYLETVKHQLLNMKKLSDGSTKMIVDDNFIFQLNTIHTYFLLTAWQSINDEIFEPKFKLDHLMVIEDDQPKNYESEYFRNIIVFQEMYEPTMEEFRQQQDEVEKQITSAGVVAEEFADVDKFFDDFREELAKNEVREIDWRVPSQMTDFMSKIGPQLVQNRQVYSSVSLKNLNREIKKRQDMLLN